MVREEEVLAALDKPHAVYSPQKLLEPKQQERRCLAGTAVADAHRGQGEIRHQQRQMEQSVRRLPDVTQIRTARVGVGYLQRLQGLVEKASK